MRNVITPSELDWRNVLGRHCAKCGSLRIVTKDFNIFEVLDYDYDDPYANIQLIGLALLIEHLNQ